MNRRYNYHITHNIAKAATICHCEEATPTRQSSLKKFFAESSRRVTPQDDGTQP
jgi:hypothetical protein